MPLFIPPHKFVAPPRGSAVSLAGTVYLSDEFNRTGNVVASASDSARGGAGTVWAGTGGAALVGNGTQAVIGTPTTFTAGFTEPTPDVGLRMKLDALPTGSSLFMNLRRISIGSSALRYVAHVAPNGVISIQRTVGGSGTTLTGGTSAANVVAGDIIEFRVVGITVSFWKNYTQVYSAQDVNVPDKGVSALSGVNTITALGIGWTEFIRYS